VRITFVMKKWTALHILFVLGVQFAPTIHNSFPHDEDKSSCTHPFNSVHLEKDESDRDAAPCFFCVHLGSRSAPLIPLFQLVDVQVLTRVSPLPEVSVPDGLSLLLPASRGPPSLLG
jgi:hypothetical protein